VQALILIPALLFFLWGAVGRYRGDRVATVAGIAVALAGALGVALSLPIVNLTLPLHEVVALGCVGAAVAVCGSVIAEVRRSRRVHANDKTPIP
jgi:hypothetical protein